MVSICQSLEADTPSSAHIEAVLVTFVVLVSPALFQGDTKVATSHMRFGYQLLVAEEQIRQEPLCSHSDADIHGLAAASVYISRSGGLEANGADVKNYGINQTALEGAQAWKNHLDVFGKFCYFGQLIRAEAVGLTPEDCNA